MSLIELGSEYAYGRLIGKVNGYEIRCFTRGSLHVGDRGLSALFVATKECQLGTPFRPAFWRCSTRCQPYRRLPGLTAWVPSCRGDQGVLRALALAG